MSGTRIYDDLAAIRAAGYGLVDEAVRYLTESAGGRGRVTTPAELARLFEAGPPEEGRGLDAVLARVREEVVPHVNVLADPMYMGHQVCAPLPVAALADAVVSVLNQSQAVWEMSPVGTLLEARLIRWFASVAGYDETAAGGSFVSGGSAANLTALLAARARLFPEAWRSGTPPGVAVVTGEQAHYSVARAAGILGFGTDAVVAVPTLPNGSTDVRALAAALDALAAEGRPVLAVVATAGSTATGAFDDLPACADLCARHGVWLHVDAAHGASGLLSELVRPRLAGIERADSLAWDPHKMMFQPLSTALVLVRDRRALESALQQEASYLFQPGFGDGRPADQGAWTIQCSRRSDALRLWLALEYYGVRTIADLFDHCVRLTRRLHELLLDAADFEPLHEPECNILCFRYTGPRSDAPDFQDRLRARYNASRTGWITAATLRGQRALRVTLINPRTQEHHLHAMLDGLRRAAATPADPAFP